MNWYDAYERVKVRLVMSIIFFLLGLISVIILIYFMLNGGLNRTLYVFYGGFLFGGYYFIKNLYYYRKIKREIEKLPPQERKKLVEYEDTLFMKADRLANWEGQY